MREHDVHPELLTLGEHDPARDHLLGTLGACMFLTTLAVIAFVIMPFGVLLWQEVW